MIPNVIAYVLALAAPAASAATSPENQALWLESKSFLEPAGIDQPMFNMLMLWTEQQYHLGYCRPYISDSDFVFWRDWWKNTVVEQTDVGRRFLVLGADSLTQGVRDRADKPPSQQLCQRTLNDWARDMKRASEVVKRP